MMMVKLICSGDASNVFPIRGIELDRNHRFLPKGEKKELLDLIWQITVGNDLEKIM